MQLAGVQQNLGKLHREAHEVSKAQECYHRASDLYAGLIEKYPTAPARPTFELQLEKIKTALAELDNGVVGKDGKP